MALLALKVTTAVTPAGGSAAATTTVKSAAVSVAAPITLGIQQNFVLGPPGVGPQWKGLYSSGTTYAQGDGVTGSNAHNYISLVSSNLNHDPTTDAGVHWADTLPPTVLSTTSPKVATVILMPSGGDDSVVAAGYIAAGGTIIMGPGTFLWNTSVPAVTRNTPTRIVGVPGQTIIRGSVAAPRFLDCPYVADYDTYSHLEIDGITFDRQSITQATNTHVFVGDLIGGGWSMRANFTDITIRRCQTLNVPTSTVANGLGNHHSISFCSKQVSTTVAVGSNGQTLPQATINVASTTGFPASGTINIGGSLVTYGGTTSTTFTGCTGGTATMSTGQVVLEGTQTQLLRITVKDCDFEHGGSVGVSIMGTGGTPVNVFYDDIIWDNVRHDTLNIPTAFHSDANFQVGGTGFGGSFTGTKLYGKGSGDVGIEMNDPLKAVLNDPEFVDFWNAGIFPNNFGGQTDINAQAWTINNPLTRKVGLGTGATTSNGIRLGGNGSANGQLGHVVINSPQHENTSQSFVAGDAICMWPVNPTAGYKSITIVNPKVTISGYNQVISVLARIPAIQISAPSGTTLAEYLRGGDININVTRAGGSTASLFLHAVGYRGTGTIMHDVDGLTGSLTEANAVGTSTQFVSLGLDTDAGTHRGVFRRVGPHTVSGDGSPIAVRFGPGNTYGTLTFLDSDLSAASAGSEFSFATAGDSAKVRCARVRRRNGVVPAPTTLTGLVTATGKALGTIHSCTVDIAPATGAGITIIEYSTDGGTTYTQVLNQAAGATPANVAINFGPLTTDSLIRVTFATTQPTINLVPFEP